MDDLVTVEWLSRRLDDPGIVVLDATYLPFEPERDAAAEYQAGHIPGARFLDLRTLADTDDPRPTMAPNLIQFRARMAALGVRRDDRIILYDDSPHRTAARAWWVLRLFGADRLAILDGGAQAWRKAGQPLEKGAGRLDPLPEQRTGFTARDDALIRDLAAVRALVDTPIEQLVDARGAPRFSGAEADPRPGIAPGHIPGSINLPYSRLFDAEGRWKKGEALAELFEQAGVDPARPLVFTCGSGVTAAGLFFAAHTLGRTDMALYDGSWSEYGADSSTPKAVS
ncbi:sulfurtransferase [Sphingomonas sp. CGMCC 1.13654]|uniref:Sulfurtransferase n=1 Tax=Sphingomonas chungangi TaxID=2683589 RepID=A0A838L298_9SPHN|nr:sulfurtransferase [Sphingomonas chungangi]MBA2932775.1 sulfurtransferase [Sphingomonas chungangi]MVW56397.1 sulfurtransferase [Sphingomonas chungangi]